MSDYSKDNISTLFYELVDAIIIVDAKNDSYHTIKRKGLFEKFVEEDGNYKSLVEKLWFHFSDKADKIADDYNVFIPMIGQFKGKYVDRIKLYIDEQTHLIQISIYPLKEDEEKYLFILDELDNSEYLRDFLTDKKVDTIQNSYLFSMYVDLIKDVSYSINVSEISDNPMNYDINYSTWRNMIVNMIWPEDQRLFMERTDPEYLKKNLLPGRTTSFDCQMKNMDGVFIWVKLIFSRTNTTNEDDFRFVFMVQNIHENSLQLFETLKKYEDLASKDALTMIFNHGRIETEMSNAIDAFRSKNEKVSLMMLDIDFFKEVNDRFGHSTGNVVLKQFVDYVVEFLKPYDIVTGRWGGEEFVCVCYGMDFAKIKIISEQLRESIAQAEFESIGHLTCSIGLTEVQTNDTDQVVFDRADKAMYEAKLNGRNCVVVK
ncbi:MAG: GGDEF domain-containing protein [Treponema sp.]|nr:GGDEF domain-containing protein [Treponema sp.]